MKARTDRSPLWALRCLLIMGVLQLLGGCGHARNYSWERYRYPAISIQIVDAQSGQPIEGAIALCVWTEIGGVVETIHRVKKVSDGVSDRQGWVKIDGLDAFDPQPPELTVYKRGYVAWNNIEVFPFVAGAHMRRDFRWENGLVVKMKRWKEGYSFNDHESFISQHTPGNTKRFADAMDWERLERVKENDLVNERRDKERITR